MYREDDYEPFDPFSVGPASANRRYEYEAPTSTTYPPPVFATWPPPKENNNRSISQSTLRREEAEKKAGRSQMAISKAIKEDMATAKQQAEEEEKRIHAGGPSKTAMSEKSHGASMTTLMAVKTHKLASNSSVCSAARSHASRTSAMENKNEVRRSDGKSIITTASGGKPVDTVSMRSQPGKIADDKDTKSKAMSVKSHEVMDKISKQAAVSKEKVADKVSQAAVKVSQASIRPESVASIKSKASAKQEDNASQHSIKSKASQLKDDSVSRTVSQHKADAISIKSNAGDGVKKEPSSQDKIHSNESLHKMAESIKEELKGAMETTQSLAKKAAELSERLKAGNEFNHNRVDTLNLMYGCNTIPYRRGREDRMSFWYKDALLS